MVDMGVLHSRHLGMPGGHGSVVLFRLLPRARVALRAAAWLTRRGPENVRQDSALAQQLGLEARLDGGHAHDALAPPISPYHGDLDRASRTDGFGRRVDLEAVAGLQYEFARPDLGWQPDRQDPHRDQVRAMNALEARREHRPDSQQALRFRGPVARPARAEPVTRHEHDRFAGGAVALGGDP